MSNDGVGELRVDRGGIEVGELDEATILDALDTGAAEAVSIGSCDNGRSDDGEVDAASEIEGGDAVGRAAAGEIEVGSTSTIGSTVAMVAVRLSAATRLSSLCTSRFIRLICSMTPNNSCCCCRSSSMEHRNVTTPCSHVQIDFG